MKLLTFAIPCYNSEAYMEKCIESLLPGGDDVEILIVDDGSHDRTAEIADAYEKSIRGLSGRFIRRTVATARRSIRVSAMPPGFILR